MKPADQDHQSLPPDLQRLIKQARDKGASSRLNAIPLEEQGFALNKREFRESVRMHCNMPLSDLPSQCACGDRLSIGHALSYKKGGFVVQRHDSIRDLLTSLLSRVYKNEEVEPRRQPPNNERLKPRSAITSPEARQDMHAGQWVLVARSYGIF